MYSRSILSPYIGQTPPEKIGAEEPNIITIANATKAGTTTGGKLKFSRKDSMFGDNENPWISFLQTYGNKGYTMPELRARYHNTRTGLEKGGRRHMYGGSQLAIGEMTSYAGPRNLARGGNSYRTRQISGNWNILPRNVVNDISGLVPLTAKVGGKRR